MIVTHLSNHTPGVIFTVHYISHLGVRYHEFCVSECMKSHALCRRRERSLPDGYTCTHDLYLQVESEGIQYDESKLRLTGS